MLGGPSLSCASVTPKEALQRTAAAAVRFVRATSFVRLNAAAELVREVTKWRSEWQVLASEVLDSASTGLVFVVAGLIWILNGNTPIGMMNVVIGMMIIVIRPTETGGHVSPFNGLVQRSAAAATTAAVGGLPGVKVS